ncbi:hypothetical protein ACP70R_004507 [Stipagrostis hirtigluma subsp. patula]
MEPSQALVEGDLDRISGLSDDLLCSILTELHSAAEAARTSVLSRRWRRVWTKIPDLIFLEDVSSPAAVDAALAAHSAPTVGNFAVGLTDMSRPVDAARAAAWLRFAAAREATEVHVVLPARAPQPGEDDDDVEEELEVPLLESTAWLSASFVYNFRLRLPPAGGAFAELRVLGITLGRVSGGDLSRVVSAQCPSLWVLELAMLDVDGDLSIRSDTLDRLSLRVVGIGRRLDVAAPSLVWLLVHGCNHAEARIAAPVLTEVNWDDAYDPARHHFTETGRRLHRLAVRQWTPTPPLLERFDAADKLSLYLVIPQFPQQYTIFSENTSKLPQCKDLTVGLKITWHALVSCLLHLLRKCDGISKLEIELIHVNKPPLPLCKILGCPCVQPESLRTDNVTVDSLEEVEIHFFTGSDEEVDLVKMLFMCKNTLQKMVINVSDDICVSKETCEKIQSFSPPNTTLEIGGSSSRKRDTCCCKDHDWY